MKFYDYKSVEEYMKSGGDELYSETTDYVKQIFDFISGYSNLNEIALIAAMVVVEQAVAERWSNSTPDKAKPFGKKTIEALVSEIRKNSTTFFKKDFRRKETDR